MVAEKTEEAAAENRTNEPLANHNQATSKKKKKRQVASSSGRTNWQIELQTNIKFNHRLQSWRIYFLIGKLKARFIRISINSDARI